MKSATTERNNSVNIRGRAIFLARVAFGNVIASRRTLQRAPRANDAFSFLFVCQARERVNGHHGSALDVLRSGRGTRDVQSVGEHRVALCNIALTTRNTVALACFGSVPTWVCLKRERERESFDS